MLTIPAFRGCLMVEVCVANRLRREGVVLRELLAGDVRVACKIRFTLLAGVLRISNVVVDDISA